MKRVFQIKEIGILIILIFLMAFLGITTKSFLTSENLLTALLNMSFIAIMAFGETMVIITAGIDLSVGSILGISSVVIALMLHDYHMAMFPAILSGLLIGTLMGLINGVLITKVKLPPFIATMGMLSVGRGLAYVFTGGWPVSPFPEAFTNIGQGKLFGIPNPVLFMLVLAILSHIFLKYTVIGRRIYAVGGNIDAARLSGVKVDKILILVYAIAGFLCAISGFLMTAWLGVGQANAGQGYELDVIAAAVIGGTSLMGGEGTILGTILGAAIMGILRNGLILLGVSSFWQQVAIGIVIISAIAFDRLRGGLRK